VRLRAPTTAAPGGGVEPALHLDFLSSDELAGQGVTLLPAATPPTVNQGMVLDGATQYARARAGFLMPQQFSLYLEFLPTFNYDENAGRTFLAGTTTAAGWLFKNNNINLNRLHFVCGAGGAIYVNGVDYGAFWRQGQRNKLCVRATSGAGVIYLNGTALATVNAAWTAAQTDYWLVGVDPTSAVWFSGTIYDVRIYTRLLTAAEALELTTLT
jgi:hypothetical protein